MTQEEKQLLLVDLCARFPYGIKGYLSGLDVRIEILGINGDDIFCKPLLHKQEFRRDIRYIKPYLRPMSSMTEEEREELRVKNIIIGVSTSGTIETTIQGMDWLNAHYFDYRGLVPKGLAISTEEFNPYKD